MVGAACWTQGFPQKSIKAVTHADPDLYNKYNFGYIFVNNHED